ncbi:MAG TPA: hypothetical protein VF733_06105, partial [Candidatus Saccharimonadales bacterium]
RGAPQYPGTGSGMGNSVAGVNVFSQGQGSAQQSDWTPTILYLFGLIIVEMVVFGFLARRI